MENKLPKFDIELLSKNLNERVKELACLFKISKIARSHKGSLSKTLEQIVSVIPEGWQYPEKIHACIRYNHQVYGNPLTTNYYQSTQFTVGSKSGDLVVFYKNTNEIPFGDSFLYEEQELINQIGLELESIIELHEKNEREHLINEKLKHNDKLQLLGEITAGVAHELNTPLANILGYSQLLISKEENVAKKENLQKILKSSLHAREIVKKLMYFSCEMPSQFKEVDLNQLVKDNIDLMKIQLVEANVDFKLTLAEELPLAKLDPIQFSQVVFNIVLNAINAMSDGGLLLIETKQSEMDVSVSFTDTGAGISQENLTKIFEPFYSTKEVNTGTGLGLAVSYGIIQAHKGRIEVASELNKGTTFTIILKKPE